MNPYTFYQIIFKILNLYIKISNALLLFYLIIMETLTIYEQNCNHTLHFTLSFFESHYFPFDCNVFRLLMISNKIR